MRPVVGPSQQTLVEIGNNMRVEHSRRGHNSIGEERGITVKNISLGIKSSSSYESNPTTIMSPDFHFHTMSRGGYLPKSRPTMSPQMIIFARGAQPVSVV